MSFESALWRLDELAKSRLEAARHEMRPFAVTYVVDGLAIALGYHPSLGDYEVQWVDGVYVAESQGGKAQGPTPDEALLNLCLIAMDRTGYVLMPPLLP